jgi:uncharacterized protein (DUF924 family)
MTKIVCDARFPMTETISPIDVITFWREAGQERWWKKNDAFDATIRARFLSTWETARVGGLQDWRRSDDGLLALTIVLDQFPRNMFRGDARTYATDALAREVASQAIAAGADTRVEQLLRQFLYMPFMHSEALDDQERCVALFNAAGEPESAKFAEGHADIVRRFGRFPHRNRILGRVTTEDEQAFLDEGGFSG